MTDILTIYIAFTKGFICFSLRVSYYQCNSINSFLIWHEKPTFSRHIGFTQLKILRLLQQLLTFPCPLQLWMIFTLGYTVDSEMVD